MTRTQLINNIKAAAGRGDMKACTRLFAENRISRSAFDQAVADGRSLGAFCAKRDSGFSKAGAA